MNVDISLNKNETKTLKVIYLVSKKWTTKQMKNKWAETDLMKYRKAKCKPVLTANKRKQDSIELKRRNHGIWMKVIFNDEL